MLGKLSQTIKIATDWLERDTRVFRLLTVGFLLLCVAFSLVTQRGWELKGDGSYYLAMQQAWLLQGWPALDVPILRALESHPDIGRDAQWHMLIDGADGRTYAIHFWFYSLLSAPFALLFGWFGLNPALGFVTLNAIMIAAAGVVVVRSPALSTVAKLLLVLSFGATSVNWYAAWSHPEAYTASLLLIAAIFTLERRTLFAALCVGAAALQNPSAVLMLGALGLAAIVDAWDGARRTLRFGVLFDQGWRLAAGAAFASIAPLFNLAVIGVANPIMSEGFVRFSQLNPQMLGYYLFGLDQGGVIGFPFVFAGIAVVIALRVMQARTHGAAALFGRADVLLLGSLLIMLPVLTQANFNAGQYYVIRYVAWTFVPALVWLAVAYDRAPAPVVRAWGGGLAVYAAAFIAFVVAKYDYIDEARRDPSLPSYRHSLQLKPWTRALFDHAPALYNPWSGVFAERVIGRTEVLESRPLEMPVLYTRADGVITKVLTTPEDPHLCDGGRLTPIEAGEYPVITDAGHGTVYLNGEMRCEAEPDRTSGNG